MKKSAMAHDRFLNPQLSIDSLDTYVIRTGLLYAIKGCLPALSGTLLDIGCGEMPYRELILQDSTVERYIGLDIPNPAYQTQRHPDLFWDGVTIPLADASIDSAIATELFEHLPDLDVVLREICRVLKPGGTLFFTVPFLWPLHDSPYDFCRYTPFSLRRHLEGNDFDVRDITALGGWNASLAQMIGLWLNRSGLKAEDRRQFFTELAPLYEELIRSDKVPSGITDQMMSPGFQGIAVKRARAMTKPSQNDRVIVIEEGFPSVSETFILDQVTGLIDRGLNIDNWALQRLQPSVQHRKIGAYQLLDRTVYLDMPREMPGDRARWLEEFQRRNPAIRLEGIKAFHVHFGPTFVQLAPLFAETDAFVLVSFHGYDASEVLKQRGASYYAGLFGRADLITVPSAVMRDTLVEAGCRRDKIVVHHYGADPGQRATNPADRTGPVNLLTIARLVEKKGIDDSLRALARIPGRANIKYRIVGEGPLRGALEQLIQELHLESSVEISGFVPNEHVHELLCQTDVFVLTSRTASNGDMEGVPVCLIEAQMAGVPVISTFHAGIPELVRDKETGLLCEEGHVPQIAAAIEKLIGDPALRQRYGAAARVHALEHFNINRLNDRLSQLIQKRTHGAPEPRPSGRATSPDVPLISVCIPTYNRGAFIGECVRSVLDQSDGRLEVIIVDDGSTDDTEDIVRNLARPEIRYVKKAHTNGADTRNRAVAEATGEYVLWVDSDDLLLPGAIRAHRAAMRTHADADVFYGDLKIFGDTRRYPPAQIVYPDYWGRNDYLLSRTVTENPVPNGGTIVRRSLYGRVGVYNPEFVRAHDYEFWCRAATEATFKHVGQFVTLWRWHDTNMSSASVEVNTAFEARVLKGLARGRAIEALFPFADWTDRNSTLIFAYFQLAKAFIKWRDKDEAFAYIERAVGVINPGWRMPTGSDENKWKMVDLLVKETFENDLQTRSEFSAGIEALRRRKTLAPTPAGFDRTFYERKLATLAGCLKARPGDAAIAAQLKAELLQKTLPRTKVAGASLVSVVIPFCQQGETIAATLDSLAAQTYRAFEVIIVSDGDPAFPDDVLTAFRRENPDIPIDCVVKPHSGVAATRDWAVERAGGQYVLPLDSADLIASIFLEKTVPVLEGNFALGFVYTETLFFGEKNEISSPVDFDPAQLLRQNLVTGATLFRRDFWASLGRCSANGGYGHTAIQLPLFMSRRKKANRNNLDEAAA